MSDRRSFSEIPEDLLRDHGVDARVDRIWERLETEISGSPRRRFAGSSGWVVVSAATFALGILVGSRFTGQEPMPVTALGAEPARLLSPAAPPATGSPSAEATHELPPSRPSRRASAARRTETGTVAPVAPPEEVPAKDPSEWQHLADQGEYVQALAALESSGGFDAALANATADELMSLVDVARATGQRDRAVLALRRIVSEHGADPDAPVAAWMLGNELSKAHDLAGAEQAFGIYRALSPGGDFAEDALARQIDMAAEQGKTDHARKLAEQYLKEFPDGPRTADIQAELERWTHGPKPAASADPSVRTAGDPDAPDAGDIR